MTYAQMLMYDEAIHQLSKLLKGGDDNAPPARRKPKRLTGEARRVLFEKANQK